MHIKEQLVIYEKMYHEENGTKEKLTIRVQIVFTLILAVLAVSSYMLRMLDFTELNHVAYLIAALLIAYFFLVVVACFYAVRVFWGNTFALLPPAKEIGDYCNALHVYNEELKAAATNQGVEYNSVDVGGEVEVFLCEAYQKCATHNYDVNMVRAGRLHLSFRWLLISLAPLICAGVLFVAFDMDASSPRKNYQVIDRYVGDQLGKLDDRINTIAITSKDIKELVMDKANKDAQAKDAPKQPDVTQPVSSAAPPISAMPKKPERPNVQFVMNMQIRPSDFESLLDKVATEKKEDNDDKADK